VILLSFFVIRKFRDTYPSVEMLKGYMVRKRLGTPVLAYIWISFTNEDPKLERYLMSRVKGSLIASILGKTNQVSCVFGA